MITLNANALTDRDAVKDQLQITGAGSNIDDYINSIINRVSTAFETFCHRQFNEDTYTEYFDGGGSWLFPNNSPVTVITSINEDSDWVWDTDTLLTSTDYRIADGGTSIYYDGILEKGPQSIQVIYTGGSSTLPEDIKQAATIETAKIVKHRNDFDFISQNRDDGTITLISGDWMPQTLKTLYGYRKVFVA